MNFPRLIYSRSAGPLKRGPAIEVGIPLLVALAYEIIENHEMLEAKIAHSHDASATAKTLLLIMADAEHAGPELQGLRNLRNVFVLEDWTPDIDVYRQAVASGQLLLSTMRSLDLSCRTTIQR